jgi:hypothetical protein
LNEEKAVQAAADLIGELFVFSVLTMSKLNMYSKTYCMFSLILVIFISYKIAIFTFVIMILLVQCKPIIYPDGLIICVVLTYKLEILSCKQELSSLLFIGL